MWSCPCSSADPESGPEKGKSFKAIIKTVIKALGPGGRISEEEMAGAWEEAVGAQAATHTRPVALRRGELIVNVDGSSWLYELTLRKREVLEKLASRLKGRKLKNIRFRIGELKEAKNGKGERKTGG